MSAQAGSRKRTRADFEREGALAEADAATAPTEPSRSLLEHVVEELEEFEAELAAVRATTTQAQRFMDHAEAKLNLSADVLECMKEEIGNMRTRALRLDNGIRKLLKKARWLDRLDRGGGSGRTLRRLLVQWSAWACNAQDLHS